jgi:hypothetical protein
MERLAMGALSSPILWEIFIQYMEHIQILDILTRYKIITYSRYVDNILIIYNKDSTNIEHVLLEFNALHPKIQFTMEMEVDNRMHFWTCQLTEHRFTYSSEYTENPQPLI